MYNTYPDRFWGPISPYKMGTAGFLGGVNRSERETEHLPTSADVKNTWLCTATPTHVFSLDLAGPVQGPPVTANSLPFRLV
jgi:hypothetical protein